MRAQREAHCKGRGAGWLSVVIRSTRCSRIAGSACYSYSAGSY